MTRASALRVLAWICWAGAVAPIPRAADAAATDSLTVVRVIELARSRAPEVLLARSRVEESRGRLDAADILNSENPSIEAVMGKDDRFEKRTEWELTVPIDPGWTRRGRTRVARAEWERDAALRDDTAGRVVASALRAFYRVLHARDRLRIAQQRLAVAERLRSAAEERHRSGDVARIDLLLADAELARARSEVGVSEGDRTMARAELGLALGVPASELAEASGDLSDRAPLERFPTVDAARPDVLAAEREVAAAEAERGLARTEALPEIAFRLDYGHASGIAVARPGVALTVPLFNTGLEARVAARGRAERARIELEARRAAARTQAEGANGVYAAARAAVEELERGGLGQSREAATLAEEGYRAGKINLPALLQVRREILETEREYADRLLEAALAAIDRAVAHGACR